MPKCVLFKKKKLKKRKLVSCSSMPSLWYFVILWDDLRMWGVRWMCSVMFHPHFLPFVLLKMFWILNVFLDRNVQEGPTTLDPAQKGSRGSHTPVKTVKINTLLVWMMAKSTSVPLERQMRRSWTGSEESEFTAWQGFCWCVDMRQDGIQAANDQLWPIFQFNVFFETVSTVTSPHVPNKVATKWNALAALKFKCVCEKTYVFHVVTL